MTPVLAHTNRSAENNDNSRAGRQILRYTVPVHRYRLLFTGLLGCAGILAGIQHAHAAPAIITYTYDHHIYTVSVVQHPEWRQSSTQWYFQGKKAVPPSRLQTCGKDEIQEAGWEARSDVDWDTDAIADTLQQLISSKFDRPAGSVRISRNSSGAIVFDGDGLPGRTVNLTLAAEMTKTALDQNVAAITLPVDATPSQVTVDDEELRNAGIREVVTVGESVFSGSPVNRRHNIAVGVNKFNGHLIPKDGIFSFVETLGPVNASTGYRKELVIQGDETIPDYGGGLCQVSSTAYRGPWEYGLPIVQRKNHSYAVTYYSPQGTDATIYPPSVDMKFKNDTPGALLIQSFVDDKSRAFFIYYGTKDDRESEVIGPFVSDYVGAPKEERIVYTTDLKPGEKKKVGERHDGMKVMWYRNVQMPGSDMKMEQYFSAYQARPLYYQIGVAAGQAPAQTPGSDNVLSSEPSWLPSKQ